MPSESCGSVGAWYHYSFTINYRHDRVARFDRLSPGTRIVKAGLPGPGPQPRNHTPFPWTLVIITLAVATALAVHELWGPTLDWRSEP